MVQPRMGPQRLFVAPFVYVFMSLCLPPGQIWSGLLKRNLPVLYLHLISSQWAAPPPPDSYPSNRRQVANGGETTLPVASGVPQMSIIEPIIFILFTSDLPAHITHGGLTSYADDSLHVNCAIPDGPGLAELRTRLELTLRELHAWFSSNSLKMNGSKTDFMIVGSRQNLKKVHNFYFNIDDSSIQPSKAVNILGVIVDPLMSWEAHISHVIRKCHSVWKCNKILFSLCRFRHYFIPDALQTIVHVQACFPPHYVPIV